MTEQMDGQVGWFDLDISFGKTSTEQGRVRGETEKERTLPPSSKKSSKSQSREPLCLCVYQTEDGQNPGAITLKMVPGALLGEYTTHSFGESPKEENESRLSQILEGCPHPKYSLSSKGLPRDFEPCGETGQETTGAAGGGVEGASGTISFQERGGKPGGGKGILIQHEHVGALSTLNNQSVLAYGIDQQGGKGGANYTEDVCPPILSDSHGTPHAVAYGIGGYNSEGMKSQNPHSGIYEASTARTLDLNGGNPACNQGGIAVVQSVGCDVYNQEDVTGALRAEEHGHQPSVVTYDARGNGDGKTVCTITGDHQNRVTDYTALCVGNGQLNQVSMAEQANTLDTMHDQQAILCQKNAIVRRLTPLECERLQGYPDGWTDIGEWVDSKGKKHKDADSPRYKALGNSIALPFWQWMARRICAQYERTVTMASLFDGIGGFPLVFSRCGATPVWASEIEEFPMAVTRVHFPEEET